MESDTSDKKGKIQTQTLHHSIEVNYNIIHYTYTVNQYVNTVQLHYMCKQYILYFDKATVYENIYVKKKEKNVILLIPVVTTG